jgi:hypothetical protein
VGGGKTGLQSTVVQVLGIWLIEGTDVMAYVMKVN